jgi:hypothetical protein
MSACVMIALVADIPRVEREQNIGTLAGGSMEKDNHVAETDAVTANLTEDTMELLAESVTVQPARRTTLTNPCRHSRAIDDVLTRGKKRSGKVRCLECHAIFDDPYQGRK